MNSITPLIAPALLEAVNSVLETMFFESAEPAGLADRQSLVWFAVDFSGILNGTVYLGVQPNAVTELAAGFTGLDPNSFAVDQPPAAMLEMANMICGGTLSRLEHDGHFDLCAPRQCDHSPPPEIDCMGFQLAAGRLAVGLEMRGAS
jgi:CheY-specific phosphatase CheX